MSVVDEIKARLDVVDVIGGYVQLKKTGRTFKGLCPFHTEKTPSFVVNADRQTWHCFGACGTGGDVFSFVQRAENLDFPGALKLLADRAGVELAPRSPAVRAEDQARARLREINAAAAVFFHQQLVSAPGAGLARDYLTRRQVDDATRDRFDLGYAPDSWDALLTALAAQGFAAADLSEAGLAIERDGGGHYDRFRARLMFPIRDERGQVIGFGGRTLGDATPKYLNSPQTLIFDKGAGLYGLDLARESIRRAETAVVVEGYMDVVSLHQRGFQNVVASLGTALTEAQVALAARFAPTLVLALDSDAAGSAATLRGLQVAARAIETRKRRVPGAGGRLNTVDKRTIDLRITVLPSGLDPDDLVKQNPAEWERRVAASKPVPDYYFTALVSDLDLKSPTGKEEAVTRLLQVIRDELDGPVEQAHYLQWLARLTRVDERQLGQRFRALGRGQSPPARPARPVQEEPPARRRVFGLEEYLLGILLYAPSVCQPLQVWLQEQGIPILAEGDFSAADNQAVFRVLSRGEAPDADETLAAHCAAVTRHRELQPRLAEDSLLQEALRAVLRLREQRLRDELAELRFLLADAKGDDDDGATRYAVRVQRVSRDLERTRRAWAEYQAPRAVGGSL